MPRERRVLSRSSRVRRLESLCRRWTRPSHRVFNTSLLLISLLKARLNNSWRRLRPSSERMWRFSGANSASISVLMSADQSSIWKSNSVMAAACIVESSLHKRGNVAFSRVDNSVRRAEACSFRSCSLANRMCSPAWRDCSSRSSCACLAASSRLRRSSAAVSWRRSRSSVTAVSCSLSARRYNAHDMTRKPEVRTKEPTKSPACEPMASLNPDHSRMNRATTNAMPASPRIITSGMVLRW